MQITLPLEIHYLILLSLVDDVNLGDDFDNRISPYHNAVPYSTGTYSLALACALVCRAFYDLSMPILWRYLIIRQPGDITLLSRLAVSGSLRATRNPLPSYTRRLDLRFWSDAKTDDMIILLQHLSGLRILVLNNRNNRPSTRPLWRPCYSNRFISSLAISCPHLRRIQFLGPTLIPTRHHLLLLSQACLDLIALQVVTLNLTYKKHGGKVEDRPFRWQSLELLSIGTGYWSRGGVDLLHNLRRKDASLPSLRRIDVNMSFERIHRDILPFCDEVHSSLLHLSSTTPVQSFNAFHNLRRLVIVLYLGAITSSLPTHLDALQEIEIMTDSISTFHVSHGRDSNILNMLCNFLVSIVDGRYASLEIVTLWKRILGGRSFVEELLERHGPLYQALGVILQSMTH